MPLVEYYESMRMFASGKINSKSMPMGLDIFMKKGLKSWIDAWYSTQTIKAIITKDIESTAENVPDAIFSDLTMLLTQMVLGSSRKEENEIDKYS